MYLFKLPSVTHSRHHLCQLILVTLEDPELFQYGAIALAV